jgi:hypothetical protein
MSKLELAKWRIEEQIALHLQAGKKTKQRGRMAFSEGVVLGLRLAQEIIEGVEKEEVE